MHELRSFKHICPRCVIYRKTCREWFAVFFHSGPTVLVTSCKIPNNLLPSLPFICLITAHMIIRSLSFSWSGFTYLLTQTPQAYSTPIPLHYLLLTGKHFPQVSIALMSAQLYRNFSNVSSVRPILRTTYNSLSWFLMLFCFPHNHICLYIISDGL